jgi:hypothetical protein
LLVEVLDVVGEYVVFCWLLAEVVPTADRNNAARVACIQRYAGVTIVAPLLMVGSWLG